MNRIESETGIEDYKGSIMEKSDQLRALLAEKQEYIKQGQDVLLEGMETQIAVLAAQILEKDENNSILKLLSREEIDQAISLMASKMAYKHGDKSKAS